MTGPAFGSDRLPRRPRPDGDARRRHPSSAAAGALVKGRDPLGKMALFSSERPARAFGTLFVQCSSCARETPVTALEAARAAFPMSLHVPFRKYHSFMRCPACGRRTWVRMRWTLQ